MSRRSPTRSSSSGTSSIGSAAAVSRVAEGRDEAGVAARSSSRHTLVVTRYAHVENRPRPSKRGRPRDDGDQGLLSGISAVGSEPVIRRQSA